MGRISAKESVSFILSCYPKKLCYTVQSPAMTNEISHRVIPLDITCEVEAFIVLVAAIALLVAKADSSFTYVIPFCIDKV